MIDTLDKTIGRYKNTFDTKVDEVLTLNDYFYNIKNSSCREVTKYRYAIKVYGKNSAEARELKLKIPAVTTSGVFRTRKDHDLATEFTRVIVLDLDAQDNVGLDLDETAIDLQKIPSTLAIHRSCSGLGLAVYVLVDEWKSNTYQYVRSSYEMQTNANFDKATSNLSRLRYLSNDPNIYVDPDAFELMIPKGRKVEPKIYKSKASDITEDSKTNGLLKWWRQKYSMQSGSRNHNSYVLARTFNSYGVDKNVCQAILLGYEASDFTSTEILGIIESAYSNIADFNSLQWK